MQREYVEWRKWFVGERKEKDFSCSSDDRLYRSEGQSILGTYHFLRLRQRSWCCFRRRQSQSSADTTKPAQTWRKRIWKVNLIRENAENIGIIFCIARKTNCKKIWFFTLVQSNLQCQQRTKDFDCSLQKKICKEKETTLHSGPA